MESRHRNDMEGVTQEEVSKLTKAMKDDQFRKYMDEYCKETSDPANRKEYLQYLDQLEAKGEMPDGQALLRTQPGCCVKTYIKFKNGQTQKCFINIVHTDQLDDFRFDEATGKGGRKVHLPYSLSPPRPDRDHNQDYCMTCDIAVSSVTYFQGMQNPQILKMLVDTAADGLGSNYLKGFEEVKKDFKVMQNLKCKGGFPMPMSVRSEILKDGGRKKPTLSVTQKDAVTPSELKQMRAEAKQKKSNEQEEEERKALAREKAAEKARRPPEPAAGPARIRVPVHRLVHSGQMNLTDFMESDNPGAQMPVTTVPKDLRLIVELPTVKKVSDVSLDVTTSNVVVEVAGKYYLDLPLPYEIEEANGSAKFDKVKQTLTLELPVKPKAPDPEALRAFGRFSSQAEDGDGAISETGGSDEELPPLADEVEEDVESKVQHSEVKAAPDTTKGAEAVASTASPQVARDGGLLEFGENHGLRVVPQSNSGADDEGSGVVTDGVVEVPGADFEASDSFTGARPGFAFKLGDLGLGYYRDLRQGSAAKARAQVKFKADEEDEIEEIDEDQYRGPLVTEVAPATGKRVSLSSSLRRYVDESTGLRTALSVGVVDELNSTKSISPPTWHQTRQNMTVFFDVPLGHEVAGVQLELNERLFQLSYCTRDASSGNQGRWSSRSFRKVLFGDVDPRQWHAVVEAARPTRAGSSSGQQLLALTLRKIDQGAPWPEAFDDFASAEPAVPSASPGNGDRGKAVTGNGTGSSPLPVAKEHANGEGSVAASQDAAVANTAKRADVESASSERATGALLDLSVAEDSTALDAAVPASHVEGPDGGAVVGPAPASAAATSLAQSAAVMGQSVLLRNRLMYQML